MRLATAKDIAIVVLSVGVAALGSYAVETRLSRYLIDGIVHEQRADISFGLAQLNSRLLEAEKTAGRFGQLISVDSAELAKESADFGALVVAEPDGVWRSSREGFDPTRSAGVWLPASAAADPDTRRFFLRSLRNTEIFGLGALNETVINSWVLPVSGGEIIFVPAWPQFIFNATVTTDYRATPWMTLTGPEQNPKARVRWTTRLYDPVAGKWLVSVVAPFFRDGVWAGSVGHDVVLEQLFQDMMRPSEVRSWRVHPMYVGQTDGAMWMSEGKIAEPGEQLPSSFLAVLKQASGTEVVVIREGTDFLLLGPLPAVGAWAIFRLDAGTIQANIAAEVSVIKTVQAVLIASAGSLIVLLVVRRRRHRRAYMASLGQRNRELEKLVWERTQKLEETNTKLQQLARLDHLTGLLNRRGFDEALPRAWSSAQRSQEALSLLMVDVDWFKQYNDRLGHPAGDTCLAILAGAMTECLRRPGDVAARYGGEEFALVLPATDSAGALQVAESLRQLVLAKILPHPSSHFEVVSVSIGVASANPALGESPETLVARADAALFEAKKNGRNRVEVAQ